MEVQERERSRHRKTTSSGHRYSRESHRDRDYEFDFNDISRASTPTSTFSSKSEGRKREKEHKYSSDDYRRKIARLKSELDLEKAKNKKQHKEKTSELREMRESYEVRKEADINDLEHKMKKRLEKEKRHLEESIRSSIMEEKDKEMKDVLKYKEDEIKELRKKYKHEKESAIQFAVENEKLVVQEKEKQMSEEMEKLKKEKEKLEEEYKKKVAEEAKKDKEFSKIKEEYDAELRRILGESKKLALGNLEKLRKAEQALSEHCGESDDEFNELEFNELMSEINQIQSQASSRAVSRSVSTTSELKFDELNLHISNLLASPAVTPGPLVQSQSVTPGPGSQGQSLTPGPVGQGEEMERPSPLTIKGLTVDGKTRSASAMSEPARDLFNRKQEERDRQLHKKVTELQTQTQRLERKIALLKTENETLKRKQDDKKPLEEKIKTLKKRNAELAAIARRLEEKAKHLQQENMKKAKEMAAGSQLASGVHGTDQMKKMFARQRAKDLAEHAKQMLAKDREIEDLRKKCQELADQLSNADFLGPENSEMYEEKEELVSIIKQAAKERLQMERQLAIAKPGPDSKVVSAEKYKELEETNETLKKEIQKLERAQSDTERLEIELTQKKLECERLTRDIEEQRELSKTLESELTATSSKNTELTEQVSSLHDRLQQLEKVNEECSTLRLSLSEAQHECEVAKGDVSVLQLKVQNLETVVQNLEFSTEKLKQVEADYHDTVLKLQDKQREIDQLQKVQESAREKYETAIKSLQDKIHGLEHQCQQHASKQQELTDELTLLRTQAAQKSQNIRNTEIQTSKSLEFAPSSTSSPNQSPRHSPVIQGSYRKSPAIAPHTPVNNSRKSPSISKSPASSIKSPGIKVPSPSLGTPSAVNRGHNSSKGNSPAQEVIQRHQATPPVHSTPKRVNGLSEQTESTKSGGTDTGFADDDDVTQSNNLSPDPDKADFEDPELLAIAEKLKELENQSDSDDSSKSDKGEDSGMESRGDHRGEPEISEISIGDSRLSVLAKKGPIQVYSAKYSYDPYKYSPNENPEAELPLQAGDYVLIYGEMDEDGFFEGELIDGRRGLVPSNFIEKVSDEDLPDFHAAMAMAGHEENSTAANSIAVPDLDIDSGDELDKHDDIVADESSQLKAEPLSDLDDIIEEDEDINQSKHRDILANVHTGAPFPKNLQLERQLANSILVSWSPPDNADNAEIRSYHVFLDGDFKTAIRGNERTKALLENVESRKIHRVSVRCISSLGQSHDNQCTILVGKDRYFNMETGLSPATSHTAKIQARNLHGKIEDNNIKPEKLSSNIEFMTARGGVPDPPVSVQVESGPQEGSILLTWLPVTIDTSGFSNGASVSGYYVYADGQKIKHVHGATNDHSILTSEDFRGFVPKALSVCTVSKEKVESASSEVVRLPQNLVKELTVGGAKSQAVEATQKVRKSPLHGHNPDEVIDSAFKEIDKAYEQKALVPTSFPDAFYDSSCSELSDIPEVEEPSSPESANENSPLKDTLHSLVNGLTNLSNDSSDFEEIYQRNLTEETNAEVHDGKSVQSSQSAVSSKSHDQQHPFSSPANEKKEKAISSKTVPQIEITRENSIDKMTSKQNSGERAEYVKSDPVGSNTKSSKFSSEQSAEKDAKYSARMDKRDGYREDNYSADSHSPRHIRDHSKRDKSDDISRQTGDSRSNKGASPNSANVARSSSPRHSKSESPGSRVSPKIKESPRSKSSPRNSDRLHDRHSPHGHRRSGASPEHTARHQSRSPVPSPNSKSNANYGYLAQVEPLELSKLEREQSDMNYPESDDDSITGEINPPVDDNRIRLFVALFDYDPQTMSPNVDSLDEELPFREGQIIKVFGDKDADGFYRGECQGRVGYIPCNMVSEIQVDDPELEEQLLQEVQQNGTMSNSAISEQLSASDKYMKPITTNGIHLSPSDLPSISGEVVVRRMVALYDYDPQELSPNVDAEVELSFKAGDFVVCYGEMDDDGFYMAEISGRKGLVPSNFLQESGVSDEEALDSVSVVTPARSGESINTSDSRKSEKSEKVENKPQQQQQSGPSPGMGGSPTKLANQHDQVEVTNEDIGMTRPRSLTPDELKQKKKSGGIFSKGKNIFKKFTR
ncbi:peripheral-type benzodiazepine receptor-associated protein 1-like isoform X4 [Mercenaria mercenaria]|uniref:peripheral-type benzodiazepine receptor-associated protein 1-like isoform X4 n=1 Tax=Mercenaria mercenaria TaxID=6596 RepID=UPI00234F2961|nr:peripheral-type benzodiazepine receptor-associated protein 1-like isoform X4 [Mercenaria mercenaria]